MATETQIAWKTPPASDFPFGACVPPRSVLPRTDPDAVLCFRYANRLHEEKPPVKRYPLLNFIQHLFQAIFAPNLRKQKPWYPMLDIEEVRERGPSARPGFFLHPERGEVRRGASRSPGRLLVWGWFI